MGIKFSFRKYWFHDITWRYNPPITLWLIIGLLVAAWGVAVWLAITTFVDPSSELSHCIMVTPLPFVIPLLGYLMLVTPSYRDYKRKKSRLMREARLDTELAIDALCMDIRRALAGGKYPKRQAEELIKLLRHAICLGISQQKFQELCGRCENMVRHGGGNPPEQSPAEKDLPFLFKLYAFGWEHLEKIEVCFKQQEDKGWVTVECVLTQTIV